MGDHSDKYFLHMLPFLSLLNHRLLPMVIGLFVFSQVQKYPQSQRSIQFCMYWAFHAPFFRFIMTMGNTTRHYKFQFWSTITSWTVLGCLGIFVWLWLSVSFTVVWAVWSDIYSDVEIIHHPWYHRQGEFHCFGRKHLTKALTVFMLALVIFSFM